MFRRILTTATVALGLVAVALPASACFTGRIGNTIYWCRSVHRPMQNSYSGFSPSTSIGNGWQRVGPTGPNMYGCAHGGLMDAVNHIVYCR